MFGLFRLGRHRQSHAHPHSRSRRSKADRRARPVLEGVEERVVMSVIYHGGAVLPHVQVQPLYYGSDWSKNPTDSRMARKLDGYLKYVVQSPYMDMLKKDGYGVGRGRFDPGKFVTANLDRTNSSSGSVSDSQLRSALQSAISHGALEAPDRNRLYVVYVEKNLVVDQSFGNSQSDFLGYHGAFAGRDASGHKADIHYAVITYPGGRVGNASLPWLSTLGQLTQVTSHELAEAVTDPNIGYKKLGWSDARRGEVGDIVGNQTTYLHGYAVQRISDRNDQAMTPAGATAARPENFVLKTDGALYKYTRSGSTLLVTGVASISDQGIDNHGQAMVDIVFRDGLAYRYDERSGLHYLASGVRSATAGQGVSYVLFTDGSLREFHNSNLTWTPILTSSVESQGSSVTAIDAGTDKLGANMVDVTFSNGDAWEHSDSSGWHRMATGVQSVSAGQQGISAVVLDGGKAYSYNEAAGNGHLRFLASDVKSATAGTDRSGQCVIDVLASTGSLSEYRLRGGRTHLFDSVASIAKAHAGVVDVVLASGSAYKQTSSGSWSHLTRNAAMVS
jgi:hypothetical protein